MTFDLDEDSEPAWLSDGSKIVFFSTRSGVGDTWMADPNGANPVNLTNATSFDGAPGTLPGSTAAQERTAGGGRPPYKRPPTHPVLIHSFTTVRTSSGPRSPNASIIFF